MPISRFDLPILQHQGTPRAGVYKEKESGKSVLTRQGQRGRGRATLRREGRQRTGAQLLRGFPRHQLAASRQRRTRCSSK